MIRHASRVKEKYNYACALSNSTFDLQHHHLDGLLFDFYTETQLLWEFNGICLCSTIHRDYHFNFLLNHSIIAKEYSKDIFDPSVSMETTNLNNPDLSFAGAEVSRETFLEYLRFLKYDIKVRNSFYLNVLNEKMARALSSIVPSTHQIHVISLVI